MKKTAPKIYDHVNKEAIRLMLEDGLDREEAYRRAVPKHFENIAVEEGKLPSIFTEMVWKALNKAHDDMKLDKIKSGHIMIRMQLQGNADRQRVYAALVKLEGLGLVYRPDGKSWARVKKVAAKKIIKLLTESAAD